MTVYLDSFTAADGTQLSSRPADSGFTWQMIFGVASAWTIVGGAANAVGNAAFAGVTVDDTDYEISIDMATWGASSSSSRIIFRAIDDANYLFLQHFDISGVGYMRFGKRVVGADSVIKDWALPAPGNISGQITIRCVGSQIDITAMGVTDSENVAASLGKIVGLRSGAYVSTTDTMTANSFQVTTLPSPPSTYLDTFTEASTVYLSQHSSDSGFPWVISQDVWQVSPNSGGGLFGPSGQEWFPVYFVLDSAAYTATISLVQWGLAYRIIFRVIDRDNYLYIRHDGAGTVTLGRRSGPDQAGVDQILETWTIPKADNFAATVTITNSGSDITIDIDGTSHTTSTILNRTATGIGFDDEPDGWTLQVDYIQVDTVVAPPLPPGASWDPAAFSGGSPITGYTLHMRTLAGEELTIAAPGTVTPLGLDLPAEMLAASGWFWVTAENAAGSSQASLEVLRAGPSTFHGFTQAEWDAVGVNDFWGAGTDFAQPYTAVNDFMLTSVRIYGDATGSTVKICQGPMVEQFNNGTPGAVLATVTGDTEVLELDTPLLIKAGTEFVVTMSRPATFWEKYNTPPAGDPALIIGKAAPDDERDGTYYLGHDGWVAMQLGLA